VKRILPVVAPGAPVSEAPFDRIGVVGLGLVGGSFALAARQRWPRSLVIGVDRNEVLERAMVRHAMDVAADDLGMIAEADLVVLAVPVADIVRLLGELPDAVPGTAVVTDVGSTKRAVMEAAAALPARLSFVGGHPIAGGARAGIDFAAPDLFAGRPWVLTPRAGGGGAALERVEAVVRAFGAEPVVMDAARHDRLLAGLSHLPQLVATTLMAVVGEACGADGLALAGRGLADTTRLASSPASVWAGICATNADEIGAVLDRFAVRLRELRASLGDEEAVTRLFDEAAAWRAGLRAGAGSD